MSEPTKELDINDDIADLGEAIVKVAELGSQLSAGRLKRRAVVLLIKDLTGLNHGDITAVLDALPRLKEYVKTL